MPKILSVLFLMVMLFGCASFMEGWEEAGSHYYDGPGSKADFLKIRYQCRQENIVSKRNSSGYFNQYGGGGSSSGTQTCSLSGFRACLLAHGYSKGNSTYHKFKISGDEVIKCGSN